MNILTRDPLERFQAERALTGGRGNLASQLRLSNIVTVAFHVTKEFGVSIARLTVIPAVWCTIAVLFTATTINDAFFAKATSADVGQQISTAAGEIVIALFVAVPLFMIGQAWIAAPAIRCTGQWVRQEKPDLDTPERPPAAVVGRTVAAGVLITLIAVAPALFGTALLMAGAVVSGGTLASGLGLVGIGFLMFDAIWASITIGWLGLMQPAAFAENLTALRSLKRSWQLTKVYKYQGVSPLNHLITAAVSVAFLSAVLYGGIWGYFSMIGVEDFIQGLLGHGSSTDIAMNLVGAVPILICVWFGSILWSISSSLIYFYSRASSEGYDIQVMNEALSTRTGRKRQ